MESLAWLQFFDVAYADVVVTLTAYCASKLYHGNLKDLGCGGRSVAGLRTTRLGE